MCVSHAQISYFHRSYVMERMQNGGSGSVAFGRAFTGMIYVQEINSKPDKVEIEQVTNSLDAGHLLAREDKLVSQTHWKPRPELDIDLNPDCQTPVTRSAEADLLVDGSGQTKIVPLRASLSDSF